MGAEAEPLNTTYRCDEITKDPDAFNQPTVLLIRADGIAGWLKITAPDLRIFEAGKEYVLSCREK